LFDEGGGEHREFSEAFTTMSNKDHRDLHSKFIAPDTSFTTPPHLDKLMAVRELNPQINPTPASRHCSWMQLVLSLEY